MKNLFAKFTKLLTPKSVKIIIPAVILSLILLGSFSYFLLQKMNSNSNGESPRMESPKDLPPIIPENDENMKNISQNSSEDAKIKEQEAQKKLQLEEEQKMEAQKNLEKQKIQKIKESLTQIDMAKHPKPWLLVGQNLLDNNKQKVIELPNLEMSDGGNYDNWLQNRGRWLDSILIKNKLYLPFWVGQIAIIDTDNGEVKWQDLGFEIKDLSMYDGKYFVMKRENCGIGINYADNCPIFSLDRGSLVEKKVYDPSFDTMGCAGCCGVIRRIVFADSDFLYLSEICSYGSKEISKYRIDNNKFVEAYLYEKERCYGFCEPNKKSVISKITVDLYNPKFSKLTPEEKEKILRENSQILLENYTTNEQLGIKDRFDKNASDIVEKFHQPARELWQKLFPFNTVKTEPKPGSCGRFSWKLQEKSDYNFDLLFDGQKIENTNIYTYDAINCLK